VTKTHTRAPLVALTLALFACKEKPRPAPPRGPQVEVFTDENARTISVEQPVALASIVAPPEASWIEVRADTSDQRFIELSPRPEDEIRLYVDHGAAAIGVFPPVTPDMPPDVQQRASLPLSSLVGITTVHVATHLPALPPLAISVAGNDVTLGDALRGLAMTGKQRAAGWPLLDVIALAGTADVQAVRILDARAQEITLDRAELEKAVLKLSSRGEYVVRVWDEGAKAPTREVRGVTKILVGDPD
jgi:hypothetical protein